MTGINRKSVLQTPQAATGYSFPMKPYDIQLDFMKRLYETIENGEFGIFESPTGTGKSLSIICGALTWLLHNRERHKRAEDASATSDELPDWVMAYERKQMAEKDENSELAKYKRWIARVRRREAVSGMRDDRKWNNAESRKRKLEEPKKEGDDEHILVDAYFSGDDEDGGDVRYSTEVQKLMDRRSANKPLFADSDSSSDSDNGTDESHQPPQEPDEIKVFYASRTHSQLQQFVNELKRTQFAITGGNQVKCVTLGSRWQLCINQKARKGCQSVHPVNERCLEMQQDSNKKNKCQYLPTQQTPMFDFKDTVGHKIMDIEELAQEGQRLRTCPYYGTRASIRPAQVVALPYNMLLSQTARESMGISLAGNVVIVDEAHNLIDTILAIHSIAINGKTIRALLEMLQMYLTKYWQRLKGRNVVYIRQTIALLKALNKYTRNAASKEGDVKVLPVNELLQQAHADHINVYKIDRYLRESKLGRKLNMFSDRQQQPQADNQKRMRTDAGYKRGNVVTNLISSPATAVATFESFMECIGNPERKGSRMVVRSLPDDVELKYLLLDPSEAFGSICQQARAVILAGGTMKPANDVVEQLLPDNDNNNEHSMLDPGNVKLYAWNHVVDSSHICTMSIDQGPSGIPLSFAFQNQSDNRRLQEAGQALAGLCNVIPGGVVAFFPSYGLLEKMHKNWTENGIIGRIEKKKPLFKESSDNVNVLDRYTEQVDRPGSTGALLLSVVGGKLSEGINFSNDLGRAVVMVGVPFPSLTSPELAERLSYYDGGAGKTGGAMGPRARQLYESLCMRAVNQSIGRAIRHREDYAAILFLDARYAEPRIAGKLPEWIVGKELRLESLGFGPALAKVATFFRNKKQAG